ncbi:MAG: hypothetical protein OZ935_16150 [Pseudomonadota bacterium]|jgi:hypothetical protein|nr:hypothetical protein [Pseudomonadota bacterium]
MKTKRELSLARAARAALLAAPENRPRRRPPAAAWLRPRPARYARSRTTGASSKAAAPGLRSALRGAEERSPPGRAQAQLARLHLMLASQCLSEASPKGERSEFDAGRTGEHRRAVGEADRPAEAEQRGRSRLRKRTTTTA